MKIWKKINNFFKLDIRWKLKKIGKLINITLYPKYFSQKGIKFIYTKFIFNLIFFSKMMKKRPRIYNNFIKNTANRDKKINSLVSSPGSGSTFVRCMLSSYFELYYKIGNGIPKYNNITNLWVFNDTPVVSGTMWSSVNIDISSKNVPKNDIYYSIKDFEAKKVVFTRYPFSDLDIYKIGNINPVILFREPLDWLLSQYTSVEKKYPKNDGEINKELISKSLTKLKEYYFFWKNYMINKENNKDYLGIEYESLVKESEKNFELILNFFDYDVSNKNLIQDSVKINSKDYALKNIKVDFQGTRFTNVNEKEEAKKKIYSFAKEEIDKYELNDLYKSILDSIKIL